MKYIEWKSISDIDYTLWIDDGSSTDTRIIGGPSPLVTETGDDEDIYTSVRLQTGNIQIAEDAVDLPAIIGKDPLSRKVTLFKSGEVYPVWKGYLQTQAFTQTWDAGPNIISLPVISALGALGSRIPSGEVADVKYISFGQFIINLVMVENTPDYRFFVFPVLSNPLVTLKYCFNLLNYGTWNEDERKYDMQSYLEILADICRTFGWTAVEKGDTLAFITPDVEGDYIMMTYANLDLLINGITPSYDTLTQSTVAQTVFGNDHTTTFMPGRRSVKVTGDINEQSNLIYEVDFDKEFRGNRVSVSKSVSDGTEMYVALNFKKQNDGIIRPRTDNYNIKLEDARPNASGRTSGCCISRERIYTYDGRTGSQAILEDTGWNDRILFRIGNLGSWSELVTFYPPERYFYNSLTAVKYMFISGRVRYVTAPDSDDWQDFTGSIPVTISVNNANAQTLFLRVVNGKFNGGRSGNSFGNQSGGYIFPVIQLEGQLKMEILVPSRDTSDYPGDLDGCNLNADYYYSIEDFRLEYTDDYWVPQENKVPKVNMEKEMIGEGFQEDLETGFGLSTRRTETDTPSPRSKYPRLVWAQYGTGLILANGSTGGVPSELYDSKTPERALVERLKKYYGRSRQRLNVTVHGTSMLDPWMLHSVGTSGPYACISQSVNWRDEQINVSLYDITDEE